MIDLIEKSGRGLAGKAEDGLALTQATEGDEEEFHLILFRGLRRPFGQIKRNGRGSAKELILQVPRQAKLLARAIELKRELIRSEMFKHAKLLSRFPRPFTKGEGRKNRRKER